MVSKGDLKTEAKTEQISPQRAQKTADKDDGKTETPKQIKKSIFNRNKKSTTPTKDPKSMDKVQPSALAE